MSSSPNPWVPGRSADPEAPPLQPLAVNVAQAAKLCSVSPREVWRQLRDGGLPSVKVGKRRIIRVVDLERWLAGKIEEETKP